MFSSFSRDTKNTFICFIYLFINYSKKSSLLWFIAYVLCFNVRPLFDRTYKYSEREYAHILTLRLNFAAFFKVICRFILESFLSNFLASLTYPEVALRSRYTFSPLFKLKYSSSSGNSLNIALSSKWVVQRLIRYNSKQQIVYRVNAFVLDCQCCIFFHWLSYRFLWNCLIGAFKFFVQLALCYSCRIW